MTDSTDPTDAIDEAVDDPDGVEEYAFAGWAAQNGEGLSDFLEEMSSVYHTDNDRINVTLGDGSAAMSHTDVMINPYTPTVFDEPVEGANILRIIDDTLAHEIAHLNWSDLDSKQQFSECYPGWGSVPGYVANAMEDHYIDYKRKNIWYGMRSKQAYKVWLAMQTDDLRPPIRTAVKEEGRTSGLVEIIVQLSFAGYAKQLDDVAPVYAEFAMYADKLLKRVRTTDDPDERFKLFHAMMQLLARYAPDPEEFDEDAAEDRQNDAHGRNPEGQTPDSAPPSANGEPQVDLPDNVTDELEKLIEEMMDDEDFPTPDMETPDPPKPEPNSSSEGGEGESGGTDPDVDDGGSESAGQPGQNSPDGGPDGGSDEGESDDGSGEDDKNADADQNDEVRDVQSVLDKYKNKTLKVVN